MDKMFDFSAMRNRARASDAYCTERAIIEFTEELCRCMAERKISRAELARRLSVAPSFVTKLLRGNYNFSLEMMTKLSRAVGTELRVHLQVDGRHCVWYEHVSDPSTGRRDPVNLKDFMASFHRVDEHPRKEGSDDTFPATA